MNSPTWFHLTTLQRAVLALLAVAILTACGPAGAQTKKGAPASGAKAPDKAPTAASEAKPKTADIDPLDWPVWRGPEYNGISRETGLPDDWDPEGPNLKWKNEKAGSR